MHGSIATPPPRAGLRPAPPPPLGERLRNLIAAHDPSWVPLLLVALGAAVYVLSNPARQNIYDHFVWQADAFLRGSFAIAWPVTSGPFQNGYLQDVLPLASGGALLPFPPLPAVVLLPFVALFGLATDAALVAALLGAINVGLAWRVANRLTDDPLVAIAATLFYGFGTVAWYAAMLGSTWFLAHVVASTCLFAAIALALDAERGSATGAAEAAQASPFLVDRRQFVAGFLFGLSALARLTTIFGAPFFLFVGGGGSYRRRGFSAAAGAFLALVLLAAYNLASSGHVFSPAYDYLYQTEYRPVPGGLLPQIFPALQGITYHPGQWAAEDPRYIPQNLVILLAWLPIVRPECGLDLFSTTCALVRPDQVGMSLLLTSPGYLLVMPALVRALRSRLVAGAALAVLAIALANLMHFSQGWVQFGYRFSNDYAPFLLVLVTLGLARVRLRWWSLALVGASILVNAWGVYWGVALGW